MPDRLYVFLHGLAVVTEQASTITIHLPEVNGHVRKAGSWLAETSIETGQVVLEGAAAGGARITQQPDGVTVNLRKFAKTSVDRRRGGGIRVVLPLPAEVLAMRAVGASGGTPILVAATGGAVWPQVSTVHILTYDIPDPSLLQLSGHRWEPYSVGGGISLHIVSAEERYAGLEHESYMEDGLRRLIQGYPGLRLQDRAPVPDWNSDEVQDSLRARGYSIADGPPLLKPAQTGAGAPYTLHARYQNQYAFALAEMEDVPATRRRLGMLGRMFKQGRPLNSLWHEPSPIGDDVTSCLLIESED